MKAVLLATVLVACSGLRALAQPAAPADTPAPAPAAAQPSEQVSAALACCRIPAGTIVELELAEPVVSNRVKRGAAFAIRLSTPVVVDGKIVIPAGATGAGEVVDAAAGGFGGKPSKLVLAGRYIEQNGVRVRLHGFRLGGAGRNNSNIAIAVSAAPYVGLLAFAVPGGEIGFPAGTRADAKITADTTLPALADAPAPQTSPPSSSGNTP